MLGGTYSRFIRQRFRKREGRRALVFIWWGQCRYLGGIIRPLYRCIVCWRFCEFNLLIIMSFLVINRSFFCSGRYYQEDASCAGGEETTEDACKCEETQKAGVVQAPHWTLCLIKRVRLYLAVKRVYVCLVIWIQEFPPRRGRVVNLWTST